jgi:hypothetical protein
MGVSTLRKLDRRVCIWLAFWVASRALIVAEVVSWASSHVWLQDVVRRRSATAKRGSG